MRNTITISVPPVLKKSVDTIMRDYKYASTSELFRDAIRLLEEDKLVKDIEKSEKDFARNGGKKLKSLKDLM